MPAQPETRAAGASQRSIEQVREHFLERLNHALRRMGMYGGEIALETFLDDLLYLDGVDDGMALFRAELRERGAAGSAGVTGAFRSVFGDDGTHGEAVQMTYADVAHQLGFLRPTRTLSPAEYAQLRDHARGWARNADRSVADMVATFGPHSVGRENVNPFYDASFAYCSAAPTDPLAIFDFVQITDWSKRPAVPRFADGPLLRCVRWRTRSFADDFTFTPTGRALRPGAQ